MTTTMQMHPATARALLEHSQRTTTRLRARKALREDLLRIGWPEAQLDAMVEAYESLPEEQAMKLHNRALSDLVNADDPEHWVSDETRERAAEVGDWLSDRPLLCYVVAAAVVAGVALCSAAWPHPWWGM